MIWKELAVGAVFFAIGALAHMVWQKRKEGRICFRRTCLVGLAGAATVTAGQEYLIHLIVYSGRFL